MIYSIGHSNHSAAQFIGLLQDFDIAVLVDVRRQPRSRRHPQFERDALAVSLAAAGIDYLWWGEALGGRRVPRPDTPHVALTDSALRGYADHMLGAAFREAAGALAQLGTERVTAVMCAEADYQHCHRQLLADHLQRSDVAVLHIVAPRRAVPHIYHAALGDACDPPVYNRHAQGDLFA